MALQNRKAFTLVELLVVITIIGMLMALLLPAVLSARSRARQTQCTNRQQELGKALLQYEIAKGHLPGYVNSFGPPTQVNTQGLSWVIMVFQYLGEGDLWKKWRDPNVALANKVTEGNNDFAAVSLPALVCPSDDPTQTAAPLSYVVNCGLSDYGLLSVPISDDVAALVALLGTDVRAANAVQDAAYGLFFDHTLLPAGDRTRVMLDRIPDGTQHTIMLSENIQASQWAPTNASVAAPWPPREPRQLDVGMVWWTDLPPGTVAAANDGRMINGEKDKVLTYPGDYAGAPGAVPPNLGRYFARPSSNHPGGAVVTFADGHTAFQSEDIEYNIYQSLMTPEVSRARTQGLVSP